MPIGDPKPLVGLVGPLAGNLDADRGVTGIHDRAHDTFDRIGLPFWQSEPKRRRPRVFREA
jgi:hypothetical protein